MVRSHARSARGPSYRRLAANVGAEVVASQLVITNKLQRLGGITIAIAAGLHTNTCIYGNQQWQGFMLVSEL